VSSTCATPPPRLLWADWVGVDKGRDVDRSRPLAVQLANRAARTEDPMIEGLSLPAKGVSCWNARDLVGAAAALDRASFLNRSWATTSHASIASIVTPINPVVWPVGHPVVAFVHMLIGDTDDALAEFEQIASHDTPTRS